MRNILMLISLVIVLAILRSLSEAAADWYYVVPVESGELAYAATFDAALDDWTLYGGRLSAQAAAGVLKIGVDAPNSLPFSTSNLHFADFDLRILARPVAGPADDNNGYGVIFRAQDTANYYLFLISSDGYYQVVRSVAGEQKELSTWIESPLINPGVNVENWLRVIAVDDQFQFFINDEPVALCIPDDPDAISTYVAGTCRDGQMRTTLVDDTLADGQVGVIARTFDNVGVEVEFDNVLIYGPES